MEEMHLIKVHKIVDQVISVFRIMGLWCDDHDCSHLCLPISLAAGAITSVNWTETIFLGVISISTLIQTVRLYYFQWKENEIYRFTHSITAHSIKDPKEFNSVNEKIGVFMKIASIYHSAIFCSGITINILALPIISNERHLPMNIDLPFDVKKSEIIYWIAFVFVAFEIMCSVLFTVFNTFIWYLMMSCATKYEILGNEFRNLGVVARVTILKKGKISAADLIALIRKHQALKQYCYFISYN